ncbi:MAG: helix-hairpin-helix domain-containing protein [Bacteroidales bacterium]|jgi:hypothetical protein|nr:helix-hairpin-helix domain-containing protein [Bacteroidales bacterium]
MRNTGKEIFGIGSRYGKRHKRRHTAYYVAVCLFLISFGSESRIMAQSKERETAEAIRKIMENDPESGISSERAAEELYRLHDHPVLINYASREDLEQIIFLSGFQIESILDYRKENGPIESFAELAALSGFDEKKAERIRPFISMTCNRDSYGKKHKGTSVYIKTKRSLQEDSMFSPITRKELQKHPDSRCLGSRFYSRMKVETECGNGVTAGFTLESDAGERFLSSAKTPVDFFSFHIAALGLPVFKREGTCDIFLGDFSARFGQGLTLWYSFPAVFCGDPSGFRKRGKSMAAYTSSDENNFLRGAAVHIRYERLNISLAASRNRLDAAIKGDGYTSLPSDGLHNTYGRLKKRKTMHEKITGGDISYEFRRIRIGADFCFFGYDKRNKRKIKRYNRYQMYDGTEGDFSVNFMVSERKKRFFGEAASDTGGSMALVAGAEFGPAEDWEAGILFRSYSRGYIAPHSGAYTSSSGTYNETGIAFACSGKIAGNINISLGSDYAYHPWTRYGIDGDSHNGKLYIRADTEKNGIEYGMKISGRCSFCRKSAGIFKISTRFFSSININDHADCKMTIEGNTAGSGRYGFMSSASTGYSCCSSKIGISAGGYYFNAVQYADRVYIYEKGLPYSFSNIMLCGRGVRGYILVKYEPCRNAELFLKYDSTSRGPKTMIRAGLKLKI